MAAAKEKWVSVVTADGRPVPGAEAGVPSSWIGTSLLPPGAKAAGSASVNVEAAVAKAVAEKPDSKDATNTK